MIALFAALALSAPVDLLRSRPRQPVALLVSSPGYTEDNLLPWALALEEQGLDAWMLSFPLEEQQPQRMLEELLPAALASLEPRPTLLLGHGPAGTLAARCVEAGRCAPEGLGLLAAPLRFEASGPASLLSSLPLGPTVDLRRGAAASWADQPLLPLLIGSPLPGLRPMSRAWAEELQRWWREADHVDLRGLSLPIWGAAASLDNLAPPESMRPQLPDSAWIRLGTVARASRELDHADLLRDRGVLERLSRRSARMMEAR